MKACLNDLCTKPESPAEKPSFGKTYVSPQNTLGVSSLCASLGDRLRAAGKSLPKVVEKPAEDHERLFRGAVVKFRREPATLRILFETRLAEATDTPPLTPRVGGGPTTDMQTRLHALTDALVAQDVIRAIDSGSPRELEIALQDFLAPNPAAAIDWDGDV